MEVLLLFVFPAVVIGLWAYDKGVLHRPCPNCRNPHKRGAKVCPSCHADLTEPKEG